MKKRPTTEQTAPKRDTPTRITKNTRPARSLPFDRKDKTLFVNHLHERFFKIFAHPLGFSFSFGEGGESLTFTTHYRLAEERPTPDQFRKTLDKVLGIAPCLVKVAVETYKYQSKKLFPKLEHARYDLWFRILPSEITGEKLKAILASTPESLAKWEQRLKKLDRSWESATLSEGAVIDITKDLFKSVLGREVTEDAISRFYYRWKKENRILHGVTSRTFTYRWNILKSDP